MSSRTPAPPFEPQPDWECISQGAEARVWKIPRYLPSTTTTTTTTTTTPLTTNNNNNNNNKFFHPCIAKERFRKSYRHARLDAKLTKQRVKSEARCLAKCRQRGVPCPAIYGVQGPVLYLQYLEGPTVRQYLMMMMMMQQQPQQQQRLSRYMSLAACMGQLIAKTHTAGVAHGDLTTSNMMIMRKRPPHTNQVNHDDDNNNHHHEEEEDHDIRLHRLYLIDFGLARSSSSVEELAVDLYVLERALLSTHPELDRDDVPFWKGVLDAYQNHAVVKAEAVLKRLDQVRQRGRKRECFG